MGARVNRNQLDMLHGPLWNRILQFAMPIAATAILGQLFNAADVAVVGNFTGAARTVSVAAVGANSALVGLVVNLFVGISLGANVVIANAIGRGDKDAVEKAVHTSVVISVVGGVIVGILAQLFAAPMMGLLNVPEEVYPYALLYLRIYLAGLPAILLYNFEAAIFRSVGETKTPLIVLTLSGMLNVILNLIFVAGLKMTVDGVAVATVASNVVSSIMLFIKLRRTELIIHVEPAKLKIDGVTLRRILRIGLPAGLQSAVFSISNIVIQSAINSLGTVIMAASSAAYNIEAITYYILNSFGQACTTFVGQNFGAGKLARCKKALALCLIEGMICLGIAIAIILACGRPMLALFNSDPQVVEVGFIRLVTLMCGHCFSIFYEVMSGYMRGFGNSLTPALLSTLGVCGIRICWIKWVFPLNKTFTTIMTVYPVSLCATALLVLGALLIYRPTRRFAGMFEGGE